MSETWLLATLWPGMALLATLLSIWLGIATALSEIVVGTVAQLVIGALLGSAVLGANDPWIKFLSGTGAIILTFLAGAELDPTIFKESCHGCRKRRRAHFDRQCFLPAEASSGGSSVAGKEALQGLRDVPEDHACIEEIDRHDRKQGKSNRGRRWIL